MAKKRRFMCSSTSVRAAHITASGLSAACVNLTQVQQERIALEAEKAAQHKGLSLQCPFQVTLYLMVLYNIGLTRMMRERLADAALLTGTDLSMEENVSGAGNEWIDIVEQEPDDGIAIGPQGDAIMKYIFYHLCVP